MYARIVSYKQALVKVLVRVYRIRVEKVLKLYRGNLLVGFRAQPDPRCAPPSIWVLDSSTHGTRPEPDTLANLIEREAISAAGTESQRS